MKQEWHWVDGQRMLKVTLTQHEAYALWTAIVEDRNIVSKSVNDVCFKFYKRGII